MQKIATVLVLLGLSACGEDPCPDGQTRIGVACVDTLPDSGTPDSGVDATDPDVGNADTGADATMDACVSVLELCNGISDDCDDNIDEGACDFPNTEATCEPTGCVVSACDEGFLDCSEGMGCETVSDRNNCGECGMVCGATEGCEAGRCVEHTLDWWWTVDGARTRQVRLERGFEQNYFLVQVPDSRLVLRSSVDHVFSPAAAIDAALLALDESGSEIWNVLFENQNLGQISISTVDGADGAFIAGDFQGRLLVFDDHGNTIELNSSGAARDGFVLRVDASGNVEVVAQLADRDGTDTSQTIASIATRSDGTVFVVGHSRGDFSTAVGGASVLTEVPSGSFSFILRLGRNRAIPTSSYPWESIAADDENLYVALRVDGDVVLDGVEYTTAEFAPLIACLDHDLAFRWVQTPLDGSEGNGEDETVRVHANDGSVYISHIFTEMHNFGGHPIAAGGYVASLLGSDGTVAWARELGAFTPAIGTAGDEVYFAGTGIGTVDLGGGSLGPAVSGDAIFGVLQTSGAYESARRFGGLDRVSAFDVQATSTGIMVSGTWSGTMNVDGVTFEAPGETFLFHFSNEE